MKQIEKQLIDIMGHDEFLNLTEHERDEIEIIFKAGLFRSDGCDKMKLLKEVVDEFTERV
ncbi:hypothetical protein ACFL6S_37670 [Candidatus Poribacteria bacterium]